MRWLLRVLGALLLGMSACPAARADDVRPPGVLERGWREADGFALDPAGRWVRVGGRDATAFYALGEQPWRDGFWPAYAPTPALKEALAGVPGAVAGATEAEEALRFDQAYARAGLLTLTGSLLALAGGLAYDFAIPNNPRQMHWSFYAATGAAGALGTALYAGGSFSAWHDLGRVDQAIAAYNREILRRRR